jgi:hypothetical protein
MRNPNCTYCGGDGIDPLCYRWCGNCIRVCPDCDKPPEQQRPAPKREEKNIITYNFKGKRK